MSKNILLTGGAGFIGSHTVEEILKTTDMEIMLVDRLSYAGNLERLTSMDIWESEKKRVHFLYHDFRSKFNMYTKEKVDRFCPNYIVHMGAETHVHNSLTFPHRFAEANVIGTLNMLDLAREVGCEKFLYISTDEVYGPVSGDLGKALHKEGEPHRPSNPYSASKSGAEAFVHAYWKSYNVPMMITSTMNNFGERQDREKFIPKVIYNLWHKLEIPIHCELDENENIIDISSRCWLHARNHANGIVFLLEKGEIGERYNIVGEWHNVFEVVEHISQIMSTYWQKGKDPVINWLPFHKYSPGHDMHYGLDGTKMKELGWIPKLGYKESLKRTINWTSQHKDWM